MPPRGPHAILPAAIWRIASQRTASPGNQNGPIKNAHGARLTVDGVFGAKTRAAVVAFQRAHRLTADGVVSAKTWGALLVTVKLGSTGAAVRAVQDQANFRNGKNGHSLNVDGIFGPKTQAWVRAFQQAAGIKADGVVGSLTWQALVTEALSG